jgi:hypothetical protein
MLRAVIVILALVLGGSIGAQAQPIGRAPQYPEHLAGWRSYMKTWGDDWPTKLHAEEARRIGDNPNVLRYLDRLYLVVDEGCKLTSLVDCPFDKAALFYLYDHFDEIGRFYVVQKAVHEDGPHYLLVSKEDGSSIEVLGLPVWSPAKSRFVAGSCGAGTGTISIIGLAQDKFRTEGTFELPCDLGTCELRWDDPSTVRADCTPGARTLRVTGTGTSWAVVPRSDPGSQMPRP